MELLQKASGAATAAVTHGIINNVVASEAAEKLLQPYANSTCSPGAVIYDAAINLVAPPARPPLTFTAWSPGEGDG